MYTNRGTLKTFLATQIALSALPLLLFISFTLVTLILIVVAAIVTAAFWISVALLILLPTLFATCSAAVFVWIWALGTYLFCRFVYRMSYVRTEQYQPVKTAKRTVANVLSNSGLQVDGSSTNAKHEQNEKGGEPARNVPLIVKRSINDAHVSPEAAANPEAVREKKEVETSIIQELGLLNSSQLTENGALRGEPLRGRPDESVKDPDTHRYFPYQHSSADHVARSEYS